MKSLTTQLTKQQWILGVALAVTLWLTWVTTNQNNHEEIALPTRTLESTRTGESASQNVPLQSDLTVLKRQFIPAQHSLFTLPPAPVAPTVVATKKPAMQKVVILPPPILPLPFKYLGRWQSADLQSVSLDYRGEVLNVQPGETIDGQYQVTKIEEVTGGLQVHFLNLSNHQTQTMRIGVSQ